MGLNSTWYIKFDSSKNSQFVDYLNVHAFEAKVECINGEISIEDHCVVCLFEKDAALKKYMNGLYGHNSDWRYKPTRSFLESMEIEGKFKIGCVDLHVRKDRQSTVAQFVCVTSDMSRMFHESKSVEKWFAELAKVLNAEICYLMKEIIGYKIVYINNREVDFEITEFHHPFFQKEVLTKAIEDIAPGAKFALWDEYKISK